TVTSINSNAIISVFNSGEHISEDCLNSIWLGFVRLDKTRNFKDNRLGLGLAVVDQIITLHNGKRGVTNKAYLSFKGVEFYISLPLIK
ncbi:MAG: ATP-binding protein, partial [Clostridium sp.]